ncbi:hypothetical protein E2C01_042276 [Portunus trituberculatus]|uniref:Uncharacterized protein n=1 Tax=Portunus trituberculatus TaxID=210409 RepID=A0A5B7FPS2_PORTR|nr:hypothetical protein [Portunus trituberculatus]
MIPSRISFLLSVQHTEMVFRHRNSNHPRENQQNISSGPPNWQRQNARGTFSFGDPAEGLEK